MIAPPRTVADAGAGPDPTVPTTMGRMPESPSFAAWLRTAPPPVLRALIATRTDLLRTDVTDLARLAALASSRAAVARGLESLDAAALRVVHRAAVLARVAPVVERDELLAAALTPAPEAALDSAVRTGLLWPADGGDPARAAGFRVQPEAGGLLPVTAAARATPQPWESARDPRPLAVSPVSAALRENAQGAGAASATALALTAVAEFAHRDVPQLVSGGVSRRDAQTLARAAGADAGQFALVAELAAALGWLSTTRDPADPQWKPTAEFDQTARAPRAQVWADLLTAWLTHPVDIAHVLAGSTPSGERIHLLGRDERGRAAFAGFHTARPQILELRRLVLVTLLRAGRGEGGDADEAATATGDGPEAAMGTGDGPGAAVSQDDLVALLGYTHPLLEAVTSDEVDQVLTETEFFGLTASPLGRSRDHALTPFGEAAAQWIVDRDDPDDVLGHREGLAEGPPAVLVEAVAAALPPLESTVTLQSDLTGVAFGPLDHAVQMQLERIADVDTRGQGTVYRFTDESVTRGLRAGETVDSIRAVLQDVSSTGVPTTLKHMITAAGARLHRVRVARARSVVLVDDPADLDVILEDPAAAALGMRRLAPTVAIAEASSDRVSVLLETEDRPVLLVDAAGEDPAGTRAPVPSPVPAPTVRTTRVPAERVESWIEALVATQAGGQVGARGGAGGRAGGRAGTRGRGGAGAGRSDGSGGAGDRAGTGADRSGGAASAASGTGASAGNTGSGGAVGPGADDADSGGALDAVLAELGEAAATGTAVDLTVTTSDGTHRTVRVVPQTVTGGRLVARTDTGTSLRVSLARIVRVRPAAQT